MIDIWNPVPSDAFLIQKLEPAIGRVFFPKSFGNNFFLSKFCLLKCESFKVLVSHTQQKNVLFIGHIFFEASIPSTSQVLKENIYSQKTLAYPPFQQQDFVSDNMPWHRDSSKLPKSLPFHNMQKMFQLLIVPNLQTLKLIFFISMLVVIYELQLHQELSNNLTLTGNHRIFSKLCVLDKPGNSPESPIYLNEARLLHFLF